MFLPRLTPVFRPTTLRTLQQPKMASGLFSSHFPGRPSLGLMSSRLPVLPVRPATSQVPRRPMPGHYKPPYESSKRYLMYGFIALNVGIWGYALYTHEQARQGNIKPFVDFQKNFMLNLNWVVDEGRYWTMLTSTWSHLGLGHIAGNMISFYFLGDFLVRTPGIGPGRFLILIVGSGLMGSLMTIIQRKEAARATGGYDNKRGLGFSGSVMGVSAAAACLYPKSKVALYGIVPVPLWALVAGYFAYDGIFYNDPNSTIGHSGHIGGLIFGVVYYVTALRGVAFRF